MRKFLHQKIDEAIRDNPDQIPLDLQGGSNLQKPKRPKPVRKPVSWTPWDAITRQGEHDPAREPSNQRSKVSLDDVMAAVEADDMIGFCTGCGSEAHGVEPDARNYPCEACGERKVFGAEELLVRMGG